MSSIYKTTHTHTHRVKIQAMWLTHVVHIHDGNLAISIKVIFYLTIGSMHGNAKKTLFKIANSHVAALTPVSP